MENTEKCENCRYSEIQRQIALGLKAGYADDNQTMTNCLINPPVLIMSVPGTTLGDRWGTPRVNINHWCGQYDLAR